MRLSSSRSFSRLLAAASTAAVITSGCGSNATVGAGRPQVPANFVNPFIRQHEKQNPNWIRLANNGEYSGGITIGPDGAVWISSNDSITRTDYWRTMKTFSLPGGTSPYGIQAGSDGNIWFAEFAISSIGKMNPVTGSVVNYAVPSGGQPLDLSPGPDQNLWFDEPDNSNNLIGRISMTGNVTEFSGSTGQPLAIAVGPDGDVYFGEYHPGGMVGRITPSGTITERSLGGFNAIAQPMITGSDGNVYFETYMNATLYLGEITSGFNITEYPFPSGAPAAGAIGTGPDGNVWLSSNVNSGMEFTTFDIATKKFLPPAITSPGRTFSYVGQFITGHDGNIWWPGPKYEYVYVYHLITATPSSLTFTAAGQQQTVTASESNFSGTLTATSSNASVATVSAGSSNTFVVTSVGAGAAIVRIFDGQHNNFAVPVKVQ